MKAIILSRVSTEEQKEAGNSLPAQIARMKRYCEQKRFTIVKNFSFDESAYKQKRDEFDHALEYIKDKKETIAIIFDKVDRLSRNIFDKRVPVLYEKALQDEIELHFVSDGQVINSYISAVEKFQFGMSLGLAKYYSDSISDNVKRAFEAKLARGEYPFPALIGYKNTAAFDGSKDIIPDPQKDYLISKMFNLYSKGNYSFRKLSEEMAEVGLLNANNNPLNINRVDGILSNPFYHGTMRIKGKLYPHKYKPLISKELFDLCQEVKQGRSKAKNKFKGNPYIFRGLIKCAKCGCSVTPETKKGKFVYYSCTNFRKQCKRIYIPEKNLLEPVYEALKTIELPQHLIDDVINALRSTGQAEAEFHKKSMASLRKDYDLYEKRLHKMYDDKLDGSITEDMYAKKLAEYKEKQTDLFNQMQKHSEPDEKFYITANTVLNLSKRAVEIFESSEVSEKQQFLSFLLQNPKLEEKQLTFELRNPFNLIYEFNSQQKTGSVKNETCPIWLGGQDSNLQPSGYTYPIVS